jgi:N-acetylglucosamine kinase-like BadF-type ATPase
VLSVDGGGTKTVAWIAPATAGAPQPIGKGQTGPSNPQVVGWSAALDQVDLAVERAFRDAQLARGPLGSACLALAGAGREDDRKRIEDWARQRCLADRILAIHDALPVLAAGTPECAGIALIAGTGSLAFGRSADGRTGRAGGWGHLMGDEGSGYAVVRAALQAIARSWDGRGPKTLLMDRFSQSLGVSEPDQLLRAVYAMQAERDRLASLAQVVSAAAQDGDTVACAILDRAAGDLAELFSNVAGQLAFDAVPEAIPVALSGGLLLNSPLLRAELEDKIREAGFRRIAFRLVTDPVVGGIKLASSGSLV